MQVLSQSTVANWYVWPYSTDSQRICHRRVRVETHGMRAPNHFFQYCIQPFRRTVPDPIVSRISSYSSDERCSAVRALCGCSITATTGPSLTTIALAFLFVRAANSRISSAVSLAFASRVIFHCCQHPCQYHIIRAISQSDPPFELMRRERVLVEPPL